MKLSEEFIDYYNKIDAYLKSSENMDSNMGFSLKVKNSKNKVVIRYATELISYGELRNAIVHNPRIGSKTIAEPHPETVKKIKQLYEWISNPKKVVPLFQFDVVGAKGEDFINNILSVMRANSFSQFPVFDLDGSVEELINTNTIARWLSKNLDSNGTVLIENVKVKDLVEEIEFKKNYKYISRNTSIYEAYSLFINQIEKKGRNLDVLFITDSGNSNESLLGLITIEDISSKV